MTKQLNLLETEPERLGAPARDQKWPAVWIREVMILKQLAPGEENVIRRLRFRPGFNIVWAKPEDPNKPTRLHESGLSGHASGKTTLCRLLRYVLGQGDFGTELTRERIRAKFYEGRIAAEVFVEGVPWLVCRPFAIGPHSLAVRGATMDQLFSPTLKHEQFSTYIQALEAATTSRLAVETFAGTGETINWAHILAWLTRDQECRYSGLVAWRDPSSQSESPDLPADDRHHLMRAVLDLLSLDEQKELELNARLVRERDEAKKRAPFLKSQAGVDAERLRQALPIELPDVADPLFLDAARRHLDQQTTQLRQQYAPAMDDAPVEKLRKAYHDAGIATALARQALEEVEQLLEETDLRCQAYKGDAQKKALANFLASRPPSKGFCNVPLEIARQAGCRLADMQPVDFGTEKAMMDVKEQARVLEARLPLLKADVAKKKQLVNEREANENTARVAYTKAQSQREHALQMFSQAKERLENLNALAANARNAWQTSETLTKAITDLDDKIQKSYERQEATRKQLSRAVAKLSDTFRYAVRAVMGREVDASCRFAGRNIELIISNRGNLTSAAIETIKIIAFDLAALVSSIEGRGFHPRFLLHDSPREADMSVGIYRRFFLLAQSLEEVFPKGSEPSFQYIATTTEPPPKELEAAPWLVQPVLDASTPEGRLLGVDL